MSTSYTQLNAMIFVHHGCCNVGIIRAGERALLIDCGNGDVETTLSTLGITMIDHILFTHHHRDSASGVTKLATAATRIGVPAAERAWFAAVETFWQDPKMRWHLYNVHPHNLMLATSVTVHDAYDEGDQIQWGDVTITVLSTPGHTDGSVAYVVDAAGERVVFSGDLIYDSGQLWELYSLQKGNARVTDYHGFLGDRQRVLQSLDTIVATQPTRLIPTHGVIMQQPTAAVHQLRQQLAECYDSYVAISALRYYFPDMFADYAGRPGHMPIREGKAVPPFLRHIGTTWIVISATKAALVMDCGDPAVLQALRQFQANGEITEVTACWVTHYHDDHVDALDQFQAAYPCPTYADNTVAAVVSAPHAFRLPCLSPTTVRIDQITQEGASWQWNEFRLTAYHFPGQTYYHGGLLVEGQGVRLFFSGDSFTMAGIDDYCSGNRNLLGAGVGYDHCLALLAELQPTHIFNCHVGPAFDFTSDEIAHMRANLAARVQSYGRLLPWDQPNYGLDEQWVRCEPYEQQILPGVATTLTVVVTNHSAVAKAVHCQPILPAAWRTSSAEQQLTIPAHSEGRLLFTITMPHALLTNETHHRAATIDHTTAAQPERIVIPIEVTYDGRALGQFREAILILVAP